MCTIPRVYCLQCRLLGASRTRPSARTSSRTSSRPPPSATSARPASSTVRRFLPPCVFWCGCNGGGLAGDRLHGRLDGHLVFVVVCSAVQCSRLAHIRSACCVCVCVCVASLRPPIPPLLRIVPQTMRSRSCTSSSCTACRALSTAALCACARSASARSATCPSAAAWYVDRVPRSLSRSLSLSLHSRVHSARCPCDG